MRTTIALAVLTFGLPALPAGADALANGSSLAHGSSAILTGSNKVVVMRPGLPTASARRLSPTAAHDAELLAASDSTAHGAITMEARQLQGAEAIAVNGAAPAGAPVTITLLAVVSTDVPTILVSRNDVVTDENGRFSAIIPIASAYERGTLLRLVATSTAGVASATTQLVMEAPNNGVSIPLEQLPH